MRHDRVVVDTLIDLSTVAWIASNPVPVELA